MQSTDNIRSSLNGFTLSRLKIIIKRLLRIKSAYFKSRKDLMYYKYVIYIVEKLAYDARSLVDVGSHDTDLVEKFNWIPQRYTIDINRPYSSRRVKGIQADFLSIDPNMRYDFALCLQVLEHLNEPASFARKLLDISDKVLVSVPYKWPKGSCIEHCQDPVDEDKLFEWFGRSPDYEIIVEEPLSKGNKSRRLIAFYHTEQIADHCDRRV